MSCIVCGKSFIKSFNDIVKLKKQNYDKNGTEYYVYKIGKVWSICKKEYFSIIYAKEKPNEYFHISEFKPG